MHKLLFLGAAALAVHGSALAQGQEETASVQPVNLSNTPQRRAHGFTALNADDLPARNHGTGVRVGAAWQSVRNAAQGRGAPTAFEAGLFHQRAISRALSWQVEGLYYRQQTAPLVVASGLRLPALLVVNPFYNLSLLAGPQLQWRTGAHPLPAAPSVEATAMPAAGGRLAGPAPAALSASLVVGAEARLGFLRLGLRYSAPLRDLDNLPKVGTDFGQAWRSGQVQLSVGAGF